MIVAADLDQTLIFSQKRLRGNAPVVTAEYRYGEPCGFMTPGALQRVRQIQARSTFFVNTLRGEEQARRVCFVEDGSCTYVAAQNGLYLYRNGVQDTAWSAHVAQEAGALPYGLTALSDRVQKSLAGILCLSKQYEYLSVFFVDEAAFDQPACEALARELAAAGWELHRQRKKLYLSPLFIDKGAVLRRVRALEDGAEAVGFGDSFFDLPMLRACDTAFAPAGCELFGTDHGFPLHFSHAPGEAGAEEILQRILEMIDHLGESTC